MVRGLLEEATAALSSLDAEALERLCTRALTLESLLAGAGSFDGLTLPETQARFRVFAAVLESTRDNLAVVEGAQPWGR